MAEDFSTVLSPATLTRLADTLSQQPITTVLTPLSFRSVSAARLGLEVSLFNATQLAQRQAAINAEARTRTSDLESEAARFEGLTEDIDQAIDFITDVISRVDRIRDFADDAIGIAFEARNGDSNSFFALGQTFDAFIRQISSTASSTFDSPNLLGSQPQSSFTYPISLFGATESVARSFLGFDYTITDTGGDIWVRDGGSTPLLRQVDGTTGLPTGESASLSNGIQLDSFANDTIDFTVAFDTAAAQSFTGTISRTGLSFLDAWLYDGLQTTDGRNRAIADLENAKTVIDANKARLNAELATAQFFQSRSVGSFDGLQSRFDSITALTLLQLQEVDREFNQANFILLTAIDGTLAARNEYLRLLPGGSPLASALIDVLT